MATPMTAAQFVAQLKKWNIPYQAYRADWATHNRGARGNGFSNVNGIIQHHTGSDAHIPGYLYNGDSSRGLPGPLCHVGNDRNGKLWLIGWGRANHAGLGDSAVLNAVISERYPGILRPTKQDYDGNGRFYGIENEYSGSHGMSHAQYLTACRFAAAICEFHGWTAKSMIGHGEWSTQKWDPGYANGRMMDMNAMRNDVQEMLDGKGKVVDDGKTDPALTPAPMSQTYRDVWRTDSMNTEYMGNPKNPYWWPESILRDIHQRVIRIEKELGK